MKERGFRGWDEVFAFTFEQGLKQKGFKLATISISILLLLLGMIVCIIISLTQKRNVTEVSSIEVVHIIDESGMEMLYTDGFIETYKEKYPAISFVKEDADVELVSNRIKVKGIKSGNTEGLKDVILHIGVKDKGYQMTLYLPKGSVLSKEDGEKFLDRVTTIIEQSKLLNSGIPMDKLMIVMSGSYTTILNSGEIEKSIGEEMAAVFFSMVCMFFIYVMNLMYSQSIGVVVSVEKTSKLMEMLLTMTNPRSLIWGKVFAKACLAIIQTVCWIVSMLIGFLVGDKIANLIYSEYSNILLEVFELLKGHEESIAFTMGAFGMAFFAVCLGFFFYCVLAGLVASFASKPETLSQIMTYHMIIMIIGFLSAYMLPLMEKRWINTFLRICPITSAYMLPGDIIMGNVTVVESIFYIVILMFSIIALVIVAGKIYKNQLFYTGIGLKDRVRKNR